jgi:hypothetical protein
MRGLTLSAVVVFIAFSTTTSSPTSKPGLPPSCRSLLTPLPVRKAFEAGFLTLKKLPPNYFTTTGKFEK